MPEEGNKTLYIPLVSNITEELDTCHEFRDPSDHRAGTQVILASDWLKTSVIVASDWSFMASDWFIVAGVFQGIRVPLPG